MKPVFLVALCVLVSAAAAVLAAGWVVDRQAEPIGTGGDGDAAFRTNERLLQLEERLGRADDQIERVEKILGDAQMLITDQPAKIALLQRDLEDLRRELASARRGDRGVQLVDGEGEAVVASAEVLEEIVAERVAAQAEESAKQARRTRFKQFEPFARMGMMRQMQRNVKRLNLNPEQQKRLEQSSTKAFDAIMPRFGVIMDPEAPAEERETAMTEIKTEIETVNMDAQSYMTPEQYQEFEEMQQQQLGQLEQWQGAMSQFGGGGGAPGGTPAPPASGSDG